MLSIKNHPEGLILKIQVQPRSSKNAVAGLHGDALKIKLTAPPVEGEANKMCVAFLAKCLGLPKSALEIVSGHTARTKHVLIRPGSGNATAEARKNLKTRIDSIS
jgi:uncharacterized protein (TIGR00251 family)